MKKTAILLAVAAMPMMAPAQTAPGAKPTPRPSMEEAAQAFGVREPDAGSPFFVERQAAKFALSGEGQAQTVQGSMAMYPKVKDTDDSASAIFKKFFTEMFASINWRSLRGKKTTQKLTLDPESFSLEERREIDATYTLKNNTSKIIRLDYPTTQRIDLLAKDAAGTVIEKWSDDRAFQPQEGIVIINPKERIEYNEKVPTRDMKPEETYTIEANMVGYPEYNAAKTVTPGP